MSSFNFKSSGKKITNRKFTNIPKSFIELKPIGIKTPLEIKNTADLYKMHTSPEDQFKDNIKNFLLTNAGERLGRYNYGANLSQFLFDLSYVEEYKQNIINQITNSVTNSFSGIVINGVTVILKEETIESVKVLDHLSFTNKAFKRESDIVDSKEPNQLAKIKILLEFSIPQLKLTNQKVEVTIFAGG
jgi:phage baseplate assembly protein W